MSSAPAAPAAAGAGAAKATPADRMVRVDMTWSGEVYRVTLHSNGVWFEPLAAATERTQACDIKWSPHLTKLHTFETCEVGKTEHRVGPDDGIGVLIDEQTGTYIKFVRDAAAKFGIKLMVTRWRKSAAHRLCHSMNLHLGYEVLFIKASGKHIVLHRPRAPTEKETRECEIARADRVGVAKTVSLAGYTTRLF